MGQAQSEAAASEETTQNSQQPATSAAAAAAAAAPSMDSLLSGQIPISHFSPGFLRALSRDL